MDSYIRIDLQTNSYEQLEILIAELSDMSFYAFEEKEKTLSAFIKEENFEQKKLHVLLTQWNLIYSKTIIPPLNWNQKWENEFSPVTVENFAGIRASFHPPIKSVQYEIIITPKMSFGTGHHPTTYLMIQQMKETDFANKKVLDFGTGTGVLAILAKKMGADSVTAIDYDEACINNARENININNCDIQILKKGNLKDLERFDIVLANINLNTILENLSDMKKLMDVSSQIIISGCLRNDEKELLRQFSVSGFRSELILLKEGWLSIKFKNGEN
jgi:ribosomal protein L11 methyltransferase